jgi:hypothetical protein
VKVNARPKELEKLRGLKAHDRAFENKGEQQYFTGLVVHFASLYIH